MCSIGHYCPAGADREEPCPAGYYSAAGAPICTICPAGKQVETVNFHNKNRVATAQGKQGIWFLLFPDRENTGNFALTQGKILRHRENIFL